MRLSVLLLSVTLIFTFLASCNKDDTQNPSKGRIVGTSDCKNTKTSLSDTVYECAQYAFNSSSGSLLIKHTNAVFNCCPGDITCYISIINDTITIEESSTEASCYCSCFYDVDFEITGVEEKEYFIRFIEPHIGTQPTLQFNVNFLAQPIGENCVERDPIL